MSIALQTFSDKIRTMNQTHSKNLTLSADEARNLHSAIFDLMERITVLTDPPEKEVETDAVMMDGGQFESRLF